MHGLADQAEFEHRAIMRDEARVGGAAGGRELRLAPGRLLDRADDEIDERPGLGDERVGIRRLPVDAPAHAVAGGFMRPALDQRLERILAVACR